MHTYPPITLDEKRIHALFNHGSPNARQRNTLRLKFGLSMRSGWITKLVGRKISAQLYDELLTCLGLRSD